MKNFVQICALLVFVAAAKASVLSDQLFRLARSGPRPNECGAEPAAREPCGRRHDAIGKWQCVARGCCWDDTYPLEPGTLRCYLAARMMRPKCNVHYKEKDDCGYYGMTEGECVDIGCCWKPSPRINDPECFFPLSGDIIEIRLIDGYSQSERQGRVEVMFEDRWGTVCDDGFGKEEADVICKMKGYASGVPKIEAYFGQGSGTIWLDSLGCTGDESNLGLCQHDPWGQHDCGHSEDAGVICYEEGQEPEPTEAPDYGSGYGYYYGGDDDDDYWYNYEYRSRLKPNGKKKGSKKSRFLKMKEFQK